jgi:CelD/BcsL family acetyltransferase involved in cellulose biosynthesis
MRVSVVRPGELGPAELARWRALQHAQQSLASPFLAPEFALAVGRRRGDARTAVLEDRGEVVGFFPFERRALGIGKPIGAGLSDCQGVIHAPGFEWAPRQLLRGCGLTLWEFDHLAAGQWPFEPYVAVREASPIMDVRDGYEAYLERLRRDSPKFVRTTLAKERKLARDVGELRFDFDVKDPAAVRTVMAWKSAQYRRTGKADRFTEPWVVGVVEDLLATREDGCAGTVSMLYAGDEPVAGHIGLRSKGVLACWFPAYDTRFAKLSPGLILHLRMAESAAALGIHHLDLGKGTTEYKHSLKSRDLTVAEGWVGVRAGAAALRWAKRTPARRARALLRAGRRPR